MKENNMKFRRLATMLDCSRNAVMNVPSLKRWIDLTADIGYNAIMLYTEDTYEVDNNPYFGYMRGRYSQKELREIEAYALEKNMEFIPAIQTLAHLNGIFRYWRYNSTILDCHDILLAEEEKTYKLIDDMFKTVSECFTTKKVHIGMDETHDLGTGKYFDINGYRERQDIYFEHLNKVSKLAKAHGLKPMMWSDMFFRMAGKNIKNYSDYHPDVVLPDNIRDLIPDGVQQVFWNYYRDNERFYAENLEKHNKLGENTVFAGGVWGWSSYSVHFSRSLANTRPALEACKNTGTKNVIATVWHNGSEAMLITALAGICWYADFDYTGKFNIDSIKQCFKRCCGDFYDDIMRTEEIEYPHGGIYGISRAIMANDPLTGLIDKHIEEQNISGDYYVKLSESYRNLGMF